jgi:hypothetical protein
VSLEYVNRRGDRYFVLQGKTKTGKPKYYCSKRAGGIPVERLPDGFEIREGPENALVYIRKIRPTRIQRFEREMVASLANELAGTAVILDADGDSLVVYASDVDPAESARILSILVGEPFAGRDPESDWFITHARYSPMFRFTLVYEGERLFSAERWCSLGRTDGWIALRANEPLEALARFYLPRLGEESVFELI